MTPVRTDRVPSLLAVQLGEQADPRGNLSFFQVDGALAAPDFDIDFVSLEVGRSLTANALLAVPLNGAVEVVAPAARCAAASPAAGVRVSGFDAVTLLGRTDCVIAVACPSSASFSTAAVSHPSRVSDCTWISLPADDTEGVSRIHARAPFPIKRLYYIYGVPAGESRGAHAHRSLRQLFTAPIGEYHLHLKDGQDSETFILNDPRTALLVPPMLWRDLDHFSEGAVCAVIASAVYDAADYIRDYDMFLTEKGVP